MGRELECLTVFCNMALVVVPLSREVKLKTTDLWGCQRALVGRYDYRESLSCSYCDTLFKVGGTQRLFSMLKLCKMCWGKELR